MRTKIVEHAKVDIVSPSHLQYNYYVLFLRDVDVYYSESERNS
jgi:hypothetical protein